MSPKAKVKKRGFVMTGGGAKGLYEAGVIQAFHLTGMEFDVITGSSIGAMNSIFFAEYLLHKRNLPIEIQQDPSQAIEALDEQVKAFHHAWLSLPDKRVIDDSEEGPIGQVKNDLLKANYGLPQLITLLWWWTDPKRSFLIPAQVPPALIRLAQVLSERLGGGTEVLRLFLANRSNFSDVAMRTYLRKFGLEHSLVPSGSGDQVMRDVFTSPVTPLTAEHLAGSMTTPQDQQAKSFRLVDPSRSLREYAEKGVSVRLTRANFRTGRLEISTYLSSSDFIRYMQKQAWRVDTADPKSLPLGSFRLQIPGNPSAIDAALASGRFPGVFAPFPVQQIYPASYPENDLLYRMLANWLGDPETVTGLSQAASEAGMSDEWSSLLQRWQNSKNMPMIFPCLTDVYVDGGAIDNTPSNSAIDWAREWASRENISKRDTYLELFTIFLHAEPKIEPEDVADPSFVDVVTRTLEIQGAAKLTAEGVTLDTINGFGQRGENLGRALQALLAAYQDTLASLPASDQEAAQEGIQKHARQLGLRGFLGESPEGILDRLETWTENAIDGLPLHVEEVRIYPQEMPLSTLQFTGRLGYKQENALKMLTMGCYNTLWTLRSHLETPRNVADDQDRRSLELARKWMGDQPWPEDAAERQALQQTWRCRREACVFHAAVCPHGKVMG